MATSSAATPAVLGYDDGEAAPVEEVLAAAARIARAVSLPVTVDFERGYGLPPAELVERFAETGTIGLNLEDSNPPTGAMIDAAEQADFVAAVRDAAISKKRLDMRHRAVVRFEHQDAVRSPGTSTRMSKVDDEFRGQRHETVPLVELEGALVGDVGADLQT